MGATNAIVSPAEAIVSPAEKSAALSLPDDSSAFLSAPRLDPHYLFYCFTCGQNQNIENGGGWSAGDVASDIVAGGGLAAPYSWMIWRPQIWPTLPPGLSSSTLRQRFLFRWAMSRLHLFADSGCGVLLIYDGEQLAHYSGFTPRYWRFPFIANGDLQIGDTWTDPEYRGRGLALFALKMIVATLARPGRRLWYVVEVINKPSIRVAEKAQFTLAAEGTRVIPWRVKLAGAYVIRRNCVAGSSLSAGMTLHPLA